MENLMTQTEGLLVLALYAAAMLLICPWGRYGSKVNFLLAGREVGAVAAGLSIAVTWIWAPALFVSTQKAYTHGIAGLWWFTVPNILCLLLFAVYAGRIRERVPDGYTLTAYMRERYDRKVHGAYLTQMLGLSACSFAVQLLAGGAVVSTLTGLDYTVVVLALSATALSYSLLSGFRASIITDYVQMLMVLGTVALVVPWAVSEAGGWSVVVAGAGGASGTHGSVFDLEVAWGFGVAATIGLMAGPFGDQTFWQRAFSVKAGHVWKACVVAAVAFAVVPLSLGVLGFLAAGTGMEVANKQLVNLQVVVELLPSWVVLPFAVMLLSGLVSTLDSHLCALSSIVGHDLCADEGRSTWRARLSMVALAVVGIAVASIPGLKIVYLWLFYGTLRAATLAPTLMTLSRVGQSLNSRGVFWGIVTAAGVGLPVFAYGNFAGGGSDYVAVGSILTVSLSGAIAWMVRDRTVGSG